MIATEDYCLRRSCEDKPTRVRKAKCPCDGECFMCGEFIARGRMAEHEVRIHGMSEQEARQMQIDQNIFGYLSGRHEA